uniref:DUF4817 domain-containing protein n=1 Tax=Graphocephala atropunctata TaxID=36148 RepID=A0A1B6L5Q6_9HEMI
MYGLANNNRELARRLYAEHFPNRRLPSEMMFVTVDDRLRQHGSFGIPSGGRGNQRTARTIDVEDEVLRAVEEDPTTSTRRLASAVRISHSSVWRILNNQLLYPYHVQRVQALSEHDYPNRQRFCEEIRGKCARNPDFLTSVLFTDKAGFNRNGIMNFHNTHHWADENPYVIKQSRFKNTFSLNVWVGIIRDSLIGPVFLPPRPNGLNYFHFLQNDLWEVMEDVPLRVRDRMWFMHDGAPPHFSIVVRAYLNERFRNKWMGRGGPTVWPARSPDLNPIDFFVWGHLTSMVYSTPVENVEQLRGWIEDGCQRIREMPGIFERVRQSMSRRLEDCVRVNGGHIEHLL